MNNGGAPVNDVLTVLYRGAAALKKNQSSAAAVAKYGARYNATCALTGKNSYWHMTSILNSNR
jgi:hypothetical protein